MAVPVTLAGPSRRVSRVPDGAGFEDGHHCRPSARVVRVATMRALGEFDLELVAGQRFCLREFGVGGAAERVLGGGLARQRLFGPVRAPGFVGDAAERDAGRGDGAVVDDEFGGHRGQREGVGGAVADLAVGGAGAVGWGRDFDGGDERAVGQVGVAVGLVAGQAVEVGERHAVFAVGVDVDDVRRRARPWRRPCRRDATATQCSEAPRMAW